MMKIRPYSSSDESTVVTLWQACGLTRPQNDPHKDIARKLKVNPELFLVAEAEGEVVGTVMAGYEGHRGWINYLAVTLRMRRQGLGRALMTEAERRLREAGCPKINLQVRPENREVLAFYASLGFAVEGAVSLGRRLVVD
jgi:ribosomal protein S18 acetylase RimI-like enzyme